METMNAGHVNQALDILGCQAEVVSLDPSSLDEVLDCVLQVGKAAGVEQRAGEVVAGLRERLASVQAPVDGLERPRVFALEWAIRRSTRGRAPTWHQPASVRGWREPHSSPHRVP
jgi:iron complex transport system substrate-binding protein